MEKKNGIGKPTNPSKLNLSKNLSTSQGTKPMTTLIKNEGSQNAVITNAEKVPQTTVAQKNKKRLFAFIGAFVLSAVLVISLVLILVFPVATRPMDISVKFGAMVNIVEVDGETPEENFLLLPGDTVDYTMTIRSDRTEDSGSGNLGVFVRIMASMVTHSAYSADGVILNINDENLWHRGADGFYYYKNILNPGEEIVIERSFSIDTSIGNEYAGQKVEIRFEADALQAEYQAILEEWPTAPYEWKSLFRN